MTPPEYQEMTEREKYIARLFLLFGVFMGVLLGAAWVLAAWSLYALN